MAFDPRECPWQLAAVWPEDSSAKRELKDPTAVVLASCFFLEGVIFVYVFFGLEMGVLIAALFKKKNLFFSFNGSTPGKSR